MAAKRRDGIKARPLADFYADDLSGSYQNIGACPGHYQIAGLYNNATDGSLLKVYSIDVYANNTILLFLSMVAGQAGAAGGGTWGPIRPTRGQNWGVPIGLGNTVLLGTTIGGITVQNGAPRTYAPGWPIAIVDPNYSFLIQCGSQGFQLAAAIWWLTTAS